MSEVTAKSDKLSSQMQLLGGTPHTCFGELLALGCINFQNICAHHQEVVLRIPKHPQLAQFNGSSAKLWRFQKNIVLS